jgi:hypothetical protein
MGVLLRLLDQVPAVDLDELVHVHAGHPQGHQHLDDELVARRRHRLRWGPKPAVELPAIGGGDPDALLRALALRVVGRDQPVAPRGCRVV